MLGNAFIAKAAPRATNDESAMLVRGFRDVGFVLIGISDPLLLAGTLFNVSLVVSLSGSSESGSGFKKNTSERFVYERFLIFKESGMCRADFLYGRSTFGDKNGV